MGPVVEKGTRMKLIEVYIPPEALNELRTLLRSRGIEELVASEVALGVDRSDLLRWDSRGQDFVPQIKVELAVADEQANSTAQGIFDAVDTRRATAPVQIIIGPLDDVIRIETGQHGSAAL